MLNKTQLLFLIILIEGYVVLACELLAIRQLVPFVGSGTETVSIIISAVLLPLAIGYHFGGSAYKRHYITSKKRGRKPLSIRKLLLRNILSALGILTIGLSYLFMEVFFQIISILGLHNRLLQTTLYSILFIVYPVFLLGQTVPLVSNYFSRRKLSEITGKMLFFSTTGSFLGSVFSTIVLMMTIGVHNTVIVTLGLLCLLMIIMSRKAFSFEPFFSILAFGLVCTLNSDNTMQKLNIVSNNAYNIVSIKEDKDTSTRILNVNRSYSSMIGDDPNVRFPYIQYIHENFIAPISEEGSPPREILIIGAGGFTLGLQDTINRYTYVDIDKDLKHVAEEHFLKRKLPENMEFIPMSARAFVHNNAKKYDLIVLDAYTNVISVPMECTTREFLVDIKNLLNNEGILVVNMVSNPTFNDKFTVRYNNTFTSVFPTYSRQIIGSFNAWNNATTPSPTKNILYLYFHKPSIDDRTIYTDDKNTFSIDRD